MGTLAPPAALFDVARRSVLAIALIAAAATEPVHADQPPTREQIPATGLHSTAAVEELAPPDDPVGWHPMPEPAPVSMRRGRRLDCWRSAGEIVVDAMFQDSCTAPEGGRQAVHE